MLLELFSFDCDILDKAADRNMVSGLKAQYDWVDIGVSETLEINS